LLICAAAVRGRAHLTVALLPLWVRTTPDLAYGADAAQRIDLLAPRWPARSPRPIVVMFHGGGWRGGSRQDMLFTFCRYYLAHGFLVANVEYRLGSIPPAVADARSALAWVYAHAEDYRIDARRVVVTGVSAGANLAMLAAFQSPRRPAAVVNFYGVSDMTAMVDVPNFRQVLSPGDPGEAARLASPVAFLQAPLPPVFSVHGSADQLVPVSQTRLLTARLRQAGGDAEELIIDGAGHGFAPGVMASTHEAVFRFLTRRGVSR
jgi:acetyl esterase/lipase